MCKITLGQKFKQARLEKGMTQQDVVGDYISRNMLSKIENDVANPSIKTIEYLAEKLNKPLSYFLENLVGKSLDTKSNAELAFENSLYMIENSDIYNCLCYLKDVMYKTKFNPANVFFGKVLYNLAYCHISNSEYEEAEESLIKSISILEKNKDYHYLGKAYFELASVYYYKSDTKTSQLYLDKAFDISNKSFVDDLTKGIELHYNLSFSLFNQKRYSEALKGILHTLDICKKSHSFYRADVSHMLAAGCFERLNNYSSAIEHIKKSVFFFDLNKKYNLKSKGVQRLGLYYFKKKMYSKSKDSFNEALSYFIENDNYVEANSAKVFILRILIIQMKYSEALRYAQGINKNYLDEKEIAYLNSCLGKSHLALNNIDMSNKHILMAKKIALKEGDADLLSDIYDSLADLSSKQNDYEKAYVYATKSSNFLKESLHNEIEVYQELS